MQLSAAGQMVRQLDPDRYLTALFADPARREALFALYAFNAELAQVAGRVVEPLMGQVRLQWWRECLGELADGGPVRHHPVAQPLARWVAPVEGTLRHLGAMIDGRERDLDEAPPASLAQLEAYALSTAAPLIDASLAIFEIRNPDLGKALGVAWALTGLLRAVRFHASQQRCWLPADLLAAEGLSSADVLALKSSSGLNAVSRAVAELASARLAQARDHLVGAPMAIALLATLARRHLNRLRRADTNVMDPKLQTPDTLAPLVLALRSALRRP